MRLIRRKEKGGPKVCQLAFNLLEMMRIKEVGGSAVPSELEFDNKRDWMGLFSKINDIKVP